MWRWWASMILVATASSALAQVEVTDAWIRATVSQQKATGAFMRLTAAQNTRVVQITTPVAGVAEIHEMSMENNMMRMRAVGALDLPAGQTIELKPGGFHLMLMDLKQAIKEGDVVPVTLVLEGSDGKRSTMEVKLPARRMGAMHDTHDMKDMKH